MPHDARMVANYFLQKGREENVPISPLKLQKLVYLAHGWSLALHGQPLIKEKPEAWRYGPVIPDLYYAFRKFGGSPITECAPFATVGKQEFSGTEKQLLDAVWKKYKDFSAGQLSTMTHEPGSAWQMTIANAWPFEPLTISDALISDEFQRRLQKAHVRAAP